MTSDDKTFMAQAIAEAQRSSNEDKRPHPLVGAVVVTYDGQTAAGFRGELKPGEHAEFTVLEKKLAKEIVAGATVYTTLEPCTTRNHPKVPCADRLAARRVRRVVIGMLDPDPRICGRGVRRLRDAGIEVEFFPHELMSKIEDLNRDFIRSQTTKVSPNTNSVSPPEEAAAFDRGACEQLALSYAERGNHSNAIAWGLRALQHSLGLEDHHAAGRTALLLAQQYRHRGLFNDSLKYYATAEQQIRQGGVEGFRPKADLLRISAGRIMVERFLLQGNPTEALREFNSLGARMKELEDASTKSETQKRWLEVYRTHWLRQQAEMYRQLGHYEQSRSLFHDAFDRYSFIEVASKAWSLLGEGEACRLLGLIDEAQRCYEGVEQFATTVNDSRLHARVLRNKAELLRATSRDPKGILDELGTLVERTGYGFGRVYHLLILGGLYLETGALDLAQSTFLEARGLCLVDGQLLGLEAVHASLGLAEAYRLGGRYDEARELLKSVSSGYGSRGIAWGYLRARLAVATLSGECVEAGRRWRNRTDWTYSQLAAKDPKELRSLSIFQNLL